MVSRWTGLSWGALGLIVMLFFMDAVVNLPRWVLDISPFTHIPRIPGGNFSPKPVVILIAIAAALAAAGLIGLRRRDFGKV